MTDLTTITPTQFENLTLDLMQCLGLKNCVWRTPGRDGGRDIQGEFFGPDFSGFVRRESWYVECKRYCDTVSWPTVWEKIAYADSNCADILLVVTSSTLSPQAIDEVNRWNEARKTPSVRFWNAQEVLNRLELFPQILIKYGLSSNPVKDNAVSILPLTKILTKYANTGCAYSEFGKSRERIDDVIHSLAELISARIEEVETAGKTMQSPFIASKDSISWISDSQAVETSHLDRYAVRAILALIRCHSSMEAMPTQVENKTLIINNNSCLPEPLCADLRTVAFWGAAAISFVPATNRIEIINECA